MNDEPRRIKYHSPFDLFVKAMRKNSATNEFVRIFFMSINYCSYFLHEYQLSNTRIYVMQVRKAVKLKVLLI